MKLTVDTHGLCEEMNLGIDTVQKVVCRPGFPDYIIPTGEPNGKRIWLLEEVKAWLHEQKGRTPKGRRSRRAEAA